ncbi:hypothetical protein LCGC14_0478620 [marine sediment metagenome]|uniref:Uncharacterized protein n=1 Tax=marine sediment metagenome TaxID=412755 RepID=A0A0F9VIQ7_9ZZZZ
MDGKIVIVDVLNKRFVQCETENNDIMLTKDVTKAETWRASRAQGIADFYMKYDSFLESETTGTWINSKHGVIKSVMLVPCKVEVKYKFIPLEDNK